MNALVKRNVVWVVIAIAVLLALLAVPVGAAARSNADAASQQGKPAAVMAFDRQMHKLWEDHVTWTRMVIVSFAAGSADYNAAVTRLLQNQADIGNALKPFYGDAAGNKLTDLLREHILIAAELLQDAKAGNTAAFNDANARWYANADEIASFLHDANPRYWPLDDMKQMMHTHLDLTLQEATARLKGDWNGDVAAYDAVHNEILGMADMLSEGIVRQFPNQFK